MVNCIKNLVVENNIPESNNGLRVDQRPGRISRSSASQLTRQSTNSGYERATGADNDLREIIDQVTYRENLGVWIEQKAVMQPVTLPSESNSVPVI